MTATILHSFAYSLDFLREQVADVEPADMAAQPDGISNHPAWIIGHLTFACQLLGGAIGLKPWLPAEWVRCFAPGTSPVADASRYPPKDSVLAALADAQARLAAAVERLDDARLDAPFPVEAYRPVFPTVRHALTQVLVGHASFHVGQLSLWRKAMGLPRLRRSFE